MHYYLMNVQTFKFGSRFLRFNLQLLLIFQIALLRITVLRKRTGASSSQQPSECK